MFDGEGLRKNREMLGISISLIGLILVTLLSGCSGGQTPAPSSGNSQTTVPVGLAAQTTVSYAASIQSLLNTYCVKCHSSAGSPAGVNLSSYVNTIATVSTPPVATTSLLFQALTGSGVRQMPPGSPLTAADIQLVTDWINQGALNN